MVGTDNCLADEASLGYGAGPRLHPRSGQVPIYSRLTLSRGGEEGEIWDRGFTYELCGW